MTIILQLCSYLDRNPLACDSPEGIAQWWLADGPGGAPALPPLQKALDFLEAAALIEHLAGTDGRERYRRTQGDAGFEAAVHAALAAAMPGPGTARTGPQVH